MFNKLSLRSYRLLATLLLVILSLIPGSYAGYFNGLPLNNIETFFVFTMLFVIWSFPLEQERKIKVVLMSVLCVMVGISLFGYLFIPYGWTVCLKRSAVTGVIASQCERSGVLGVENTTFIVPEINYQKRNFPLDFMNDLGLNFYQAGEPDRNNLIYSFSASTYFRAGSSDTLRVYNLIPGSQLSINGLKKALATGENEIFSLPKNQIVNVALEYQTARKDSDLIRVTTTVDPVFKNKRIGPLFSIIVFCFRLFQYVALAIGIICLALVILTAFLRLSKRFMLYFSLLLVWIAFALLSEINAFVTFAVVVVVLSWIFLLNKGNYARNLFSLIITSLFFVTFFFVSATSPYGRLILFSGGNDELGHEGFSRVVLLSQSINEFAEGGERMLYYYQPLHRYLLALFHLFLGESMWGPYVIQTFLAVIGIFVTIVFLKKINFWVAFIVSFLLGVFLSISRLSLFNLTQTPYQQAISVPLIIIAFVSFLEIFRREKMSVLAKFVIGALIGAVISTRMDTIPLILFLPYYVFFALKARLNKVLLAKSVIALSMGALLFPSLIVIRNYYVAGELSFFATSTMVNVLPDFRSVVPYVAGPSNMTGGDVIFAILRAYNGRHWEMVLSLYNNIVNNYIGTDVLRQILWILVIPGTLLLFVFFRRRRSYLLIIPIVFWSMVFTNAFFLPHNGIAMTAHFDYMVIVIVSLGLGGFVEWVGCNVYLIRLFGSVVSFFKLRTGSVV